MSISIALFKTGLALTAQSGMHFLSFDKINVLTEDIPVDLAANSPLGVDLTAHGIIGLVELGPGYLVLIADQECAFQHKEVEIQRVLKTLVIPLKFELCQWLFEYYDETIGSSSTESSVESLMSDNKKKIANHMKKSKDILFSKIGVYADDLKSSASLSLSKKAAQPSFKEDTEPNEFPSAAESGLIKDEQANDTKSIRMSRSITLRRPTLNTIPVKPIKYNDISTAMLSKFEKQLHHMFQSKDFYYSDQVDLTRRIEFHNGKLINEPTCTQTGKAFWFNCHMTRRFQMIGSDLSHKKLVQGFVGCITLQLEITHTSSMKQGQILLISKRSTKRPGLRYLRRGIDDNSNVANFVHTSQIFIMDDYELEKYTPTPLCCKFDIIRGSIPLFFTQNPSSLKPIPYLTKPLNDERTIQTFEQHFKRIKESYGDVSCISLVERSKKECQVGQAFVTMAQNSDIPISWFDFHKVCSGMKFDNVVQLLDSKFESKEESLSVEQKMIKNGYFDSIANQKQLGVFRVNCIDCLDRTNLVQKFLGEYLLIQHLFAKYNLVPSDRRDFQKELNNLWADNGDFISRQYAGTNALKGDYTRTSKRNYKGLMQDAWLTINRYYTGYISDYFKQCVIEYLIGEKGTEVFLEFERSFNVKDTNVSQGDNEENSKRARIVEELKLNDVDVSHTVLVEIWAGGFESSMNLNELRLDGSSKSVWVVLTSKSIYFITFGEQDDIKELIKLNGDEIGILQYGVYFKNGGPGLNTDSLSKNPERNIGLKFVLKNQQSGGDGVEKFLAVKFPQDMEYPKVKHSINLISKTLGAYLEPRDILTLRDAGKLNKFTDFVDGIEYNFKKMIWG